MPLLKAALTKRSHTPRLRARALSHSFHITLIMRLPEQLVAHVSLRVFASECLPLNAGF